MKKTIWINVLIIFLLFCAGRLVAQNDTRNYQNLMDRGNISNQAMNLVTHSRKSIPGILRKIDQQKITNLQLYFVSKHDPNLSYVYMPKKLKKLPMTSGRFFVKSDFQSPIPFVVLGQTVAAQTAYKPQSQSYYQLRQNYYSVIGVTGLNNTKNLNQHVFISTSPKQHDHTQLRNFQIIVDGEILHYPKQLQQLKKAFKARQIYRINNHLNPKSQTWWNRWGQTLIYLGIIALLVLSLTTLLQVPTVRAVKISALRGDLLTDYQLENWFKFLLTQIVVFVAAGGLVFWRLQLLSWNYLLLYFLALFTLVNLGALIQIFFINFQKGSPK